ncbi:MAG: type III pantothenate kinase [Kiloniellales bacterium]|nr:type III pantothenate kinase [Kiloniellales bacterium]
MLLTIDSGNTNIVFAVFDGEEKRVQWRASTDAKRTADEYAVWLTQLMALERLSPADIDGAIIASVVPAVMYSLTTLCRRYFETEPMVVGDPGVDLGIEIRIRHPEQVGADRLVNALAAHSRFGGPLIMIDFGTATTFDVVAKDGAYEGGVIAPGVNESLVALSNAAAKLPRIAIEKPPQQVIGQGTVSAMQSGAFWGYVGLVEGLIERIRAEYGEALPVIATGGLAALFVQATTKIDHVDPDINLRGLAQIYAANKAARG